MSDKRFGRRRFLQSATTVGIGVIGGLAASGTAAAANDREIKVTYEGSDSSWEYDIITDDAHTVEKGPEADENDSLSGYDTIINGTITDGGIDTYYLDQDDAITQISVYFEELDGPYVDLILQGNVKNANTVNMDLRRDGDPSRPDYEYSITCDPNIEEVNGSLEDEDNINSSQDSIDGVLTPGDRDQFGASSAPHYVAIDDPNGGLAEGIKFYL